MSRSGARSAPRRVSDRLVGRTDELAALAAAVSAPPAIVVVEGEAGIGKSRLVAELPGRLPDHRFLTGACEFVQEPFPLAAVLEAIEGLAGSWPDGLNPLVGALAPVLPEYADRLPPAPPALGDQRAERHRLLRAVATFLGELGTAVLVLEDVHWADDGTAELLAHLTGRMPPGLSVVLTTRNDDQHRPVVLERLGRTRSVPPVHIALGPLPPGEVGALAARLLGSPVPDRFAASLHELSAGIPFVIEEVVAGVVARGGTPQVAAGPPPSALRDVLLPRMESLDESSREVLGAAAVLASTDIEVLAAVVDREPGTVVRALNRAQVAGLLHEEGFRHALARQVVYEALPGPVRRWLHQRVAEVLEAGPEPRPVAQLAHHFREAGRTADFVRYAEAAAELARSRGEDGAAARYLIQAVEAPGQSAAARVRLAGKLARAAVHGLEQSEAMPVLDGVLSDPALDPAERGELRFLLGRLLRQQGEALRGYAEIERSTADLAERPDQLARALAILAVPETVTGRHVDEHRARCAEAVRVAAGCADPAVTAAVGIAEASLRLELADPDAEALVDSLLASPALAGVPRERARACLNWAQDALHVGDVALAERMLALGKAVVGEAEYLRVSSIIELVATSVDRVAGRWSGLADRARRIVREPSAFAAANLDASYLLGSVLAVTGDQAEARQLLREVVATAERVGALWPLVPARATLARLLLDAERPAQAVTQARAGLDVIRAKGNWAWAGETVLVLVECAADGDVVGEFADGIAGQQAPVADAYLAHCRGVLDGAEHHLRTAHDAFARLHLPYEATRAAERLGLLTWNATGEAKPLSEALHGYDRLGAEPDLARLLRTMRRAGIPVPYPWRGGRRSYGSQLSPRELEVARLAAGGHTNQEIAERLYVSRRTVESHIASALRKLNGQRRKDLAVLLAVLPPDDG